MDERIKLTQHPSGGPFLKVAAVDFFTLGQTWIESELVERGYSTGDLGPAVRKGRFVEIPIRRGAEG